MARIRKQSQKALENIETNALLKPKSKEPLASKRNNKKQAQSKVPNRKNDKAAQKEQDQIIKAVEQIEQEKNERNDTLKVIRDSNHKMYEGLYVDLSDFLTKLTRLTIQEFPEGFLPPVFKSVVPIYIERKPIEIKQPVYLSNLKDGFYQTGSSKSDKNVASSIKTLLKYESLKKYNTDDLTELVQNHREVFYSILLKAQTEKLSLSTLKGYLSNYMRILFIAFKSKNEPVYVKYASILKDLGSAVEAIDKKNSLNENEMTRWLDWSVILNKQRELKQIFDNIPNKKTKEAYDANLNLVLLSLYTLTPPLRREVLNLLFKNDDDDKSADFIHIKRKEVVLDLNLDKKRHKEIEIPCNPELEAILRQSYALYPRRYVFTDARKYPVMNKKLSEGAVSERLRKMFVMYGKNIGASILRASFVTYMFETANHRLTMEEIESIAILMRSSPTYLLTSYRKILTNPVKNENENDYGYAIVNPIPVKEKFVDDPYVKHNEKIKEKYKNNEEYRKKTLAQQGEYRQKVGKEELQKRKLISMLRNSPSYRSKVKKTTLDKYGINLADYT